ncbi:MAG: Flp pilus assembly complex ATPase component TadA [Clostridiales bacterium]|nr:Flp pilus assembly complex ATPase component TadA [Clostridiales bacterium]
MFLKKGKEKILTIEVLIKQVENEIKGLLRNNLYESSLNVKERELLKSKKKELRRAVKVSGTGDLASKAYIKLVIRNILLEKIKITSHNIEEVIPFDRKIGMNIHMQFSILLYKYKKVYGDEAFIHLVERYHLVNPKESKEGIYYEITEREISDIFKREGVTLSFLDKIEILTQKIYEMTYGSGSIDELCEQKIDGISGGTSNGGEEEKSIWLYFQGKSIHLSFLSFGTVHELERVCRVIYRYEQPGQLSKMKGYIINEMADKSRVVVTRPPFSEGWTFFVRKFDSLRFQNMENLFTDKNSHIPISILKWIVKGCQVTGITGSQGSGKTTLLMALINFISPSYTLRIQEMNFELHLRDIYPNRNIVSFRETESISAQEGLDLQKKTDGTVNILGEIANAKTGSYMIQMAMTASLFTMFTHHAVSTESLILSLRNSLLECGQFQNERIAEEQVVRVLDFDIHLSKDINGHRCIERITEIIPESEHRQEKRLFKCNDIICYKDGKYETVNPISPVHVESIRKYLTEKEQEEFDEEILQLFYK